MRISRIVYYVFIASFLVFFGRSAIFWYDSTYSEDSQNAGVLLYASLVMIETMALYLIAVSPRYRHQQSRIPQLCFLWEAMMLVVMIYTETSYSQWFKCFAWPLFFEAAYLFIRTDKRMVKVFRKVFFALAVLGCILFVQALLFGGLMFQTNMIYFFLLTVPVLLLTSNKKQRYYILVLATFSAFLSMKRSMILAFVLFWGFVELKSLLGRGKKKYAILLSAVMIIAVYGAFNVADDLTGGHLSERIFDGRNAEGDISNGREEIYLATLELIKNESLPHFVLGNGHNAVRQNPAMGISAHNEFLEILYDYGIIILLIYLCFWAYILKQWYYHYRHDTIYFMPYTLSVCIFAVMAMVSQLVLYCSYFLYLVFFWGMVAALKDRNERERKIP